MPLSEFTKKLIETKLTEYCDRKIPIDVRDQVKLTYKIAGYKVNLVETRPYYRDPSIWTETPIAQFRFDRDTQKWSLFLKCWKKMKEGGTNAEHHIRGAKD